MSKEREMIEKLCSFQMTYSDWLLLIADAEELLAQPEQEPVAWCQLVDGKVQDLLTSFEMKDWLYDKSWIPLYLAPQNRELIDWETKKKTYLDEIDRLGMEANKDQEEIDRLTDLLFSKPATYIGETQWMQVPEPLSDGAVCEILLKKEWRGFVELVRIIEKAHGIGGVE